MHPRTAIQSLSVAFALLGAGSAPAQTLTTSGPVARLAQPAAGTCTTSPIVYYFAVQGSAPTLNPGEQLVLLVNPVIWDGSSIGWVSQCLPPAINGSQVAAIGQVGSNRTPGGEWYAGQMADVVLAVTTTVPAPATIFTAPSAMPGFVAASAPTTVQLTAANTTRITAPCDASKAAMAPIGAPSLGNTGYAVEISSTFEGSVVGLLIGQPTYVPALVPGGCELYLAGTPSTVAVTSIQQGTARFGIGIPNRTSLRGLLFALQGAVVPTPGAVWTTGSWLVTPY